jgi:hypothetical protein
MLGAKTIPGERFGYAANTNNLEDGSCEKVPNELRQTPQFHHACKFGSSGIDCPWAPRQTGIER